VSPAWKREKPTPLIFHNHSLMPLTNHGDSSTWTWGCSLTHSCSSLTEGSTAEAQRCVVACNVPIPTSILPISRQPFLLCKRRIDAHNDSSTPTGLVSLLPNLDRVLRLLAKPRKLARHNQHSRHILAYTLLFLLAFLLAGLLSKCVVGVHPGRDGYCHNGGTFRL
jgi:hypothetical protein